MRYFNTFFFHQRNLQGDLPFFKSYWLALEECFYTLYFFFFFFFFCMFLCFFVSLGFFLLLLLLLLLYFSRERETNIATS